MFCLEVSDKQVWAPYFEKLVPNLIIGNQMSGCLFEVYSVFAEYT